LLEEKKVFLGEMGGTWVDIKDGRKKNYFFQAL
jgi:hypothetical protein